jgi:hypothetical protein
MSINLAFVDYLGFSQLTASTVSAMLCGVVGAISSVLYLLFWLLFVKITNEAELQQWVTMKLGVENARAIVKSLNLLFDLAELNSDSQERKISEINDLLREIRNQAG